MKEILHTEATFKAKKLKNFHKNRTKCDNYTFMQFNLELESKAKKSGGDRYSNKDEGFSAVYVPQTISRTNNEPSKHVIMNVEYNTEGTENMIEFTLEKKAARTGGDKYHSINDDKFNIYFPQSISRKNSTTPVENLYITLTPI